MKKMTDRIMIVWSKFVLDWIVNGGGHRIDEG